MLKTNKIIYQCVQKNNLVFDTEINSQQELQDLLKKEKVHVLY